jgi:hypothetical protein
MPLPARPLGIPLWGWGIGALGVAYFAYHEQQKSKQQAAAQQSAQATAAAQAANPTAQTPGSDPTLLAYQAGEASGVAGYSAGVSAGISLVDSIMGLFPGGTSAAQAGSAAATTTTSTTSGGSAATPSATQVGSGYLYAGGSEAPVTSSTGQQFEYVSKPAQETSLLASPSTASGVYYSPVPGVFAPINGSLSPGTPIYELLPSSAAA